MLKNADVHAIVKTRVWEWIDNFIIKENICPFAQKERIANTIELHVLPAKSITATADAVLDMMDIMVKQPEIETSLLIVEPGLTSFEEYLEHLSEAEYHIEKAGFEGIFQLASFHPEYQFEGEDSDALSHYSNRAPYPIFHIIREQSITDALASFANPERIPERNIEHCEKLGLTYFNALLNKKDVG